MSMDDNVMNVVETAKANGNFGTLLDLVEDNGLTETLGKSNLNLQWQFHQCQWQCPFPVCLEDTEDLTVLAPTNDIFGQLPPGALDGIDTETVLLKHVLTVRFLKIIIRFECLFCFYRQGCLLMRLVKLPKLSRQPPGSTWRCSRTRTARSLLKMVTRSIKQLPLIFLPAMAWSMLSMAFSQTEWTLLNQFLC